MPLITMEPNRWSKAQAGLAGGGSGSRLRNHHVRRPVRGIVIKDDTFATLRVVSQDDNAPVYLVDGGSNRKVGELPDTFRDKNGQRYTDVYSNFLIQNVSEERMEKAQILETFGEPFIFLFGERARLINVTGILLNSFDFNWKNEWLENYERFLRGTKCVENNALVFVSFDDVLVGGYILSTTVQQSSVDKNFVQFNFQLFVTNYSSFSKVGSPYADPSGSERIISNQEVTAAELDVFRPKREVPSDFLVQFINANNIGQVSESSFFDSLQSGVKAIQSAFNRVKITVNSAVRVVSEAMNGEIIRVPRGFEGSLVFNDGLDPEDLSIRLHTEWKYSKGGVINYTTFSDNTDEFVGSSDHYGTSYMRGTFESVSPIMKDRKLVAKARELWAQYGFTVPDASLNPTSAFLLKKGLGALSVGLTKGWKSASVTAGLGAAANSLYLGSGAKGAVALAGRAPEAVRQLKPGSNPE
jgi:hypothetical protein